MTLSTGALFSALAAASWGDLLSLLVRVTLIASIGGCLCAVLRNASAAMRHLAAMTTLAVLIGLPVAWVLLPTLSLPILPAMTSSTSGFEDPIPAARIAGDSHVTSQDHAAESQRGLPRPLLRTQPGRVLALAILVALVVTSALLLHLLVSVAAAWITARRARRIDDIPLRRDLDDARERLGVSRAVDLRESASVCVPAVWGFFVRCSCCRWEPATGLGSSCASCFSTKWHTWRGTTASVCSSLESRPPCSGSIRSCGCWLGSPGGSASAAVTIWCSPPASASDRLRGASARHRALHDSPGPIRGRRAGLGAEVEPRRSLGIDPLRRSASRRGLSCRPRRHDRFRGPPAGRDRRGSGRGSGSRSTRGTDAGDGSGGPDDPESSITVIQDREPTAPPSPDAANHGEPWFRAGEEAFQEGNTSGRPRPTWPRQRRVIASRNRSIGRPAPWPRRERTRTR